MLSETIIMVTNVSTYNHIFFTCFSSQERFRAVFARVSELATVYVYCKPFWAENIFENNFVANPKKRPVFTEPNKSSHFNLYTIRIA